jgi:hypothetical protein
VDDISNTVIAFFALSSEGCAKLYFLTVFTTEALLRGANPIAHLVAATVPVAAAVIIAVLPGSSMSSSATARWSDQYIDERVIPCSLLLRHSPSVGDQSLNPGMDGLMGIHWKRFGNTLEAEQRHAECARPLLPKVVPLRTHACARFRTCARFRNDVQASFSVQITLAAFIGLLGREGGPYKRRVVFACGPFL